MSNKPFYIKFLKSPLPLEEGCIMYDTDTKKTFTADEDANLAFAKSHQKFYKAYRVDAYICTRDKQLLCPNYYDTVDHEFFTLDQIEKVYGLTQAMKDNTMIPVLGLLSPEALWVAQGDEFDYSEVEPYERWFVRGTLTDWIKLLKVDPNAIDQTNFAKEKRGEAIRAICVKNNHYSKFY